ncbi:MAG: RIP metalloprotease RseP [Acidocella sp. 20-57-95]|nr:MAG: RIP metalloprotease RseP [Acidocella sp. 20-57-95]OYV60729.1 MAG: RIP metalloprotease RseP [Acidocella sp. 21-58-7]HQT64430.1 RIP metalloprotease RseP [Acidocella sp.]HQU03634.1 RIP metalloprotease RseP [Acidocella sp.]
MIETIRSVLAFLVVLGVLVFFHELGHYAAARARGVVVEAFSIGFGPTLLSWQAKSGTVWKLSALPLGGYVKMQGWGEDEAEAPKLPGSFAAASLGSKALIVAAGPIANMVLAFVLYTGLFALNGQIQVQPVLSKIIPGSPAAVAGLLPGDRILSVGGHPIQYFDDIQTIVMAHPDTDLVVEFERGSVTHSQEIKTGHKDVGADEVGLLGVEGDQYSTTKLGPVAALAAAGQETWKLTTQTLSGLANLVFHGRGAQDLGGPLRIAQMSGTVAALGIPSLISFIAMLSVNLGLINLVPIPILDGGHLLFYFAEAIYGRPIPKKAQEYGMRIGFALLLSLFAFTTLNDLTALGAVHWVAHLLG